MNPDELEAIISGGLPGAHVTVTGDGRHFEAVVVSDRFEGLSVIKQHRLVYATLGDRFDTETVHALSIRTYTPDRWSQRQG